MAANAPTDTNAELSARARFLAIVELVALFLIQAEPPALVNCLRVCRQWQDIIQNSEEIQEHMFLKPIPIDIDKHGGSGVSMNPVMKTHFAAILAPQRTIQLSNHQYAVEGPEHRYLDLEKLPWARDGTHANARSRLAFAREEASWRKMLISQPSMRWIDCWHTWESANRRNDEQRSHLPLRNGSGHFHGDTDFITLGSLWNFLEARLLRGCTAQVTFFPQGGSADQDPAATEWEKRWQNREAPEKGFSMALPRVNVVTHQVWPGEGPSIYQEFNVSGSRWDIRDELPFIPQSPQERRRYEAYDGEGVQWLAIDCRRDTEMANWRWSRVEVWQDLNIRKVRSRVSGAESSHTRRLRETIGMQTLAD